MPPQGMSFRQGRVVELGHALHADFLHDPLRAQVGEIVASISDRRCDVDFIKQLFEAGMNVVRMNTAHASREGFEALIANVRAVSNRIAKLCRFFRGKGDFMRR